MAQRNLAACRTLRLELKIEKPPSVIIGTPSQVSFQLRASSGVSSLRASIGIAGDESAAQPREACSTSTWLGTDCSGVSWPLGRSATGGVRPHGDRAGSEIGGGISYGHPGAGGVP